MDLSCFQVWIGVLLQCVIPICFLLYVLSMERRSAVSFPPVMRSSNSRHHAIVQVCVKTYYNVTPMISDTWSLLLQAFSYKDEVL